MIQDQFDSLQNNRHVQLLRKPKISRTVTHSSKQIQQKPMHQNVILRSNGNVTVTEHWLSAAAAAFCGLNLPFFLVNCLFNVM